MSGRMNRSIHVRLPDDVYEAMTDIARERRWTLSTAVVCALEEYAKRQDRPKRARKRVDGNVAKKAHGESRALIAA